MIKLPEPEGRICFDGGDWEEDFVSSQDAYSEEQMLQFRRDVLEEAAKVADATVCDTHTPTGVKIYGQRAGKAIRALLKETNDKTT
jgi:hypothetical protein